MSIRIHRPHRMLGRFWMMIMTRNMKTLILRGRESGTGLDKMQTTPTQRKKKSAMLDHLRTYIPTIRPTSASWRVGSSCFSPGPSQIRRLTKLNVCSDRTARSWLRCVNQYLHLALYSFLNRFQLYGADVIKPNHHYAMHTPEDVRNYGPLQEYWTFLFERMNKVLKSFNSSNHSGGELETSFFREFHRTVQTSRIVCPIHHPLAYSHSFLQLAQAASFPSESPMRKSAEAMYKATADDRGTIQALARQLDEAQEDGEFIIFVSDFSQLR